MKTLPGYLNTLFINIELIYIHVSCYPDDMCYETQEDVFIYTAKRLDSSTSLLQWEQLLNLNEAIIQHPPFWEYVTQQFTGDVCSSTLQKQSPWTVWVKSS